jgi:hypothetical protein
MSYHLIRHSKDTTAHTYLLWRTAGQPPGGDSSRPGDRQNTHHEAMAPSAVRTRSRWALRPGLIGADWGLVSNQGLIAHQPYKSHKAARRDTHRGETGGGKDSRIVGDGHRREFSFWSPQVTARRYPREGLLGRPTLLDYYFNKHLWKLS